MRIIPPFFFQEPPADIDKKIDSLIDRFNKLTHNQNYGYYAFLFKRMLEKERKHVLKLFKIFKTLKEKIGADTGRVVPVGFFKKGFFGERFFVVLFVDGKANRGGSYELRNLYYSIKEAYVSHNLRGNMIYRFDGTIGGVFVAFREKDLLRGNYFPVAFLGFDVWKHAPTAFMGKPLKAYVINKMGTHRKFSGKGLMRILIKCLMDHRKFLHKNLPIITTDLSEHAVIFFKKIGWKIVEYDKLLYARYK